MWFSFWHTHLNFHIFKYSLCPAKCRISRLWFGSFWDLSFGEHFFFVSLSGLDFWTEHHLMPMSWRFIEYLKLWQSMHNTDGRCCSCSSHLFFKELSEWTLKNWVWDTFWFYCCHCKTQPHVTDSGTLSLSLVTCPKQLHCRYLPTMYHYLWYRFAIFSVICIYYSSFVLEEFYSFLMNAC